MSADLSSVKANAPAHVNLDAYRRKVSAFRHNMLVRERGAAKPYQIYLKELGQTFSKEELEVLLVTFIKFSPREIVHGKAMAPSALLFGGIPNLHSDPDVFKYYFPMGKWEEIQGHHRAMGADNKLQYRNPSPAGHDAKDRPIYLTESREQRLVRQLKEGEYLFSDLGGLVGGFGFYYSKNVQGYGHDDAVKRGEFLASAIGLMTAHVDNKGKSYNPRVVHTPKQIRGKAPVQPKGAIGNGFVSEAYRLYPILPKPTDVGRDLHQRASKIFKSLIN